MPEDNTNLFPEKEIFDMSFLEFIKFDKAEINNKTTVDKALQEYFFLLKKGNDVSKLYWKLYDELVQKVDKINASIDYTRNIIENRIINFHNEHKDLINYKMTGDGVSVGVLSFEHGEITITKKEKIEFKLKPVKNDAKA